MSRIVIVAGPQSAGKSTVLTKLNYQPAAVAPLFPGGTAPFLFPIQESRQIVVHKHMLLGGIFMSLENEREVVACDLERMDRMLEQDQTRFIYLDECNIFTVAHAAAHDMFDIQGYWDKYIQRLTKLKASVIFIDIPPSISWERRLPRYQQRLVYFPREQHEEILARYQAYLEDLHPRLHDVYSRLPFPKAMLNGLHSEENVLRAVCQEISTFLRNE